MATPTILDEIKLSLGKSSNTMDTDIEIAIATAKQKISMCGVEVVDDTDALTKQAIILWCRFWYNFQGEGARYLQAFEGAVNGMALCGDYHED